MEIITLEVAEVVKRRSLNAIGELDSIVADIKGKCPEADFEFLRRGAGMSIIEIQTLLLDPIFRSYPGLDDLK